MSSKAEPWVGPAREPGTHAGSVERPVHRWPEDVHEPDRIAHEEPLEIRIEGTCMAVTMRTPGDDLDLAAGFLLTEGVVDGADDLVALRHVDLPGDRRGNTIDVVLAGGVAAHRDAIAHASRELYATSACGICGKASLDRIVVRSPPLSRRVDPDPEVLVTLPARLRQAQPGFAATGGLHGAALFTLDGTLELCREDIGRHNAVDKVLGARLRADRVPVDDRILVVSGRLSFEIVQKARVAGVPVVAGVGAASSLAVDLAAASGVALVGFLSASRFTRYT